MSRAAPATVRLVIEQMPASPVSRGLPVKETPPPKRPKL